jgi:pSer/pThr/pTyr-binding forkhead associated (FHA) protein
MNWQLELEKVVPRWTGGEFVYSAFADEDRPQQHIVALPLGALLRVGRSVDSDIHVPLVDAARRQCEIWHDETGAWLRELHGRNGTLLHGRAVPNDRAVPMYLDDVFQVAENAFVLTARFDIQPAWRHFQAGVIAPLARGVAGDRRAEDLPVLADALEDAGCDLDELLRHLREPHPRQRRCWIVKRLLRGLTATPAGHGPPSGR